MTRAHLIEDIRVAAKELGEPLAPSAYMENARRLGVAAYYTQVRHFGSFPAACKAAGVSYPPSRKRTPMYSLDDCLDALRRFRREAGGDPSYARYTLWAQAQDGAPSANTIRMRVGGWERAKRLSKRH